MVSSESEQEVSHRFPYHFSDIHCGHRYRLITGIDRNGHRLGIPFRRHRGDTAGF